MDQVGADYRAVDHGRAPRCSSRLRPKAAQSTNPRCNALNWLSTKRASPLSAFSSVRSVSGTERSCARWADYIPGFHLDSEQSFWDFRVENDRLPLWRTPSQTSSMWLMPRAVTSRSLRAGAAVCCSQLHETGTRCPRPPRIVQDPYP